MKKVLILALLAFGCNKAGTVEQTTPTPPPPVVEKAANPYEGTYTFLRALMDETPAQFAALCSQTGGTLDVSEKFNTCVSDNEGFAIELADGHVTGSSILMPFSEAKLVAEALLDELGPPTAKEMPTVVWDLDGFVLVFSPVSQELFIVVLQRKGDLT